MGNPRRTIITVARKPVSEGTVAENVLAWGCGGLNIGACRIGVEQTRTTRHGHSGDNGIFGQDSRKFARDNPPGRWPANVVLGHLGGCTCDGLKTVSSNSHVPAARGPGGLGTSGHKGQVGLVERREPNEVVAAWACEVGCPVAEMDEQSTKMGMHIAGNTKPSWHSPGVLTFAGCRKTTLKNPDAHFSDPGGASRFFKQVQEGK